MILRIFTAVLLFLSIQSVQAAEPKQENKAPLLIKIFGANDPNKLESLFMIDGELLFCIGNFDTPDPNGKTFQTLEGRFDLQETPKGQLIILRLEDHRIVPKQFDLEGYYVTSDYSSTPPSIKLTKEPEKNSYWKVPTKKGPIVNLSDLKRPFYLSVDSSPINYIGPGIIGHIEFRKPRLSFDPKDQFEVEKLDPAAQQ